MSGGLLTWLLVLVALFFAALWLVEFFYARWLKRALDDSLSSHRQSLAAWGETLDENGQLIAMLREGVSS